MIELEKIIPNDDQIRVLYELLKARKHRISHQSVPNFEKHKIFVENYPYRIWYLITANDNYIGSAYLNQDNTIGVNVEDEFVDVCLNKIIQKIKNNYNPLPEIKSVRYNFFAVNVPPSNQALLDALKSNEYQVLQVTYKI